MRGQEKLFSAILQNAEMGSSSIKEIFPKVRNTAMKNELRHQLSEYEQQSNIVSTQLSNLHLKPQKTSPFVKLMTSTGIKCKLAQDKSTGHIAEMIIQGTNMGIIKINQALNASENASPQIVSQAKDLLNKEQHYLDRMKNYL